MKLYIQPDNHAPILSVTDLMDTLYRSLSLPFARDPLARPTYLDKECTKIHCYPARRSFEDLLLLAQTYFPESTEKDLMQALKNINVLFYFCLTIGKIVFHYNGYFNLNENNFYQIPDFDYLEGTYTAKQLTKIYNQLD